MKNLVYFLLFCALAFAGYRAYFKNDTSGYSLSTIESNPVPREIFFNLVKETAYISCPSAQEGLNISSAQCEDIVTARLDGCIEKASSNAPEAIGEKKLAKCLHKAFLNCVTPYVFNNGIEAKPSREEEMQCR